MPLHLAKYMFVAVENGSVVLETKMVSTENETIVETQDKDVICEGNGFISVYDQWVAPSTEGQQPKPRYEHGAAVVGEKMYVYGGNHNGRYLSDLQVLDLRTWTWSKVEVKAGVQTEESQSSIPPIQCAGHTLRSLHEGESRVGQKDGVIIVDHGSRRKESNLMLNEFVMMFKSKTGYPIVEPAHMELAEPTIRDAFGSCVQQGANRVIISPFFLFHGRHWHQMLRRLAQNREAAKKSRLRK